jgi:DnaK suppressor protein
MKMAKASFKETMKKLLLAMKEDILVGISNGIKSESDYTKREIGDIHDISSSERDRELSLILGDRDREKLARIESALLRIEEDIYGFCEECGEKIADGRLKILPFTTVCVECKSKDEKEQSLKKTYVEEDLPTQSDVTSFEEEE